MFIMRRCLSVGLRTTLSLLQENVISMQSLGAPLLSIKRNMLTRKSSSVEYKPPVVHDNTEEGRLLRDQLKGKLQLAFTCKKCNSRNHKIITKKAYEKGVVIVRCEGCKNNHLIADNLGWFQGSGPKNIEKLLKEKGEHVRRIRDDSEGYFEVLANEELKMIQQAMKEVRSESSETPKDQEPEIHKLQYEKVGQEQK
ncbi:DNL-type zinc finger protein-like [Trichogramma pretiosum]|uniref:DNL-type zinc finger protein-like n=1 Tax=Trichogramma pretiosum TaxID=7493 RepID=UPI0006C98028|nr:DNL-type zinc finger protein-like [Trichogramma pretiosum]